MSSDSTEPDWSEPAWAARTGVAYREDAPAPRPGDVLDRDSEAATVDEVGSSAGGDDRPAPEAPDGDARPARRRWPVVVGSVAAALVVVPVATEVLGRSYVSSQVEQRLRDSGMSGRIDVTVGSSWWRPAVLSALTGRGLDELDVLISNGTVGGLKVSRADYRLHGIAGSLSVASGNVVVRSIDRGDVRIVLPAESLGSAVGTQLEVVDGRLWASGATPADRREVAMKVVGGSLELGGDAAELWGGPVEVPIADSYLLPCPPSVRLDGDLLVLRCSGDRLPGVLESPLSIDPSSPTAPVGDLEPPQSIVRPGG